MKPTRRNTRVSIVLLACVLLLVGVTTLTAQVVLNYTLPDGRVITGTYNPDGTLTYAVDGSSITIDPTDPNYVDELTAWVNSLFGVGLSATTVAESRTYHETVAGTYRGLTRSVSTYLTQQRAAARYNRITNTPIDGGGDETDEEETSIRNYLSVDTRFESFADDTDADGEVSGITNFGYTWSFDPITLRNKKISRFFGLDLGVSGIRDDTPTGIQTTVIGLRTGSVNYEGFLPGSVDTYALTIAVGADREADELRSANVNWFYSFTGPFRIAGREWGAFTMPFSYNTFLVVLPGDVATLSTATFDSPFALDLYYPLPGGVEMFLSQMSSIRWIEQTTVSDGTYGETDSDALAFGAYTADIGARYRFNQRVGLQAAFTVGAYPGSVTSIGFSAGIVY